MNKDLDYYLNLPYTRELIPDPEGGWFVRIKELPGCLSQGETPAEAMEMIADALRAYLEVELRRGAPIPEPRPLEEYSGKFVVRLPKSLHAKISETAEAEGVSLNQWLNTVLAEAVGERKSKVSVQSRETAQKNDPPAWPGLSAAVQQILQNAGLTAEAAQLDETLFANWLDQQVADLSAELQKGNIEQTVAKLNALTAQLEAHQKRAPILCAFVRLSSHLAALAQQGMELRQKVSQAEKMQPQIRALIASINQPQVHLRTMRLVQSSELLLSRQRAGKYQAEPGNGW